MRLTLCKECKFHKDNAIFGVTCGTFGAGEVVTNGGDEVKLCGCVMSVKAKLHLSECPAGKWGKVNFSKQEEDELREFMVSLEGKSKVDDAEIKELYRWHEKFYGSRKDQTRCAPCIIEMIEEIKQTLKQ